MVKILLDPPGDPESNMAADEEIARRVAKLGSSQAILRIYGWRRPAISLGRRQRPDDLPPDLLRRGLPMVHRPTGGGAVVHRLDELTYAVAIPRKALLRCPLRLSRLPHLLHRNLRSFLVEGGHISPGDLHLVQDNSDGPALLCFSSPVSGDLIYRNRKVAGSALRARREGLLIQGSLQGMPLVGSVLREALSFAVVQGFGGGDA